MDRQVHAFDMRRADMGNVGIAFDAALGDTGAFRRVISLIRFRNSKHKANFLLRVARLQN